MQHRRKLVETSAPLEMRPIPLFTNEAVGLLRVVPQTFREREPGGLLNAQKIGERGVRLFTRAQVGELARQRKKRRRGNEPARVDR